MTESSGILYSAHRYYDISTPSNISIYMTCVKSFYHLLELCSTNPTCVDSNYTSLAHNLVAHFIHSSSCLQKDLHHSRMAILSCSIQGVLQYQRGSHLHDCIIDMPTYSLA